eukprot:NODE_2196_length_969_cov_83.294565_g1806_i0.p1 GENE.NODE_2196_length_969_cov_83.294565_g1806_i0~~NODE_2196_length_969_cov_83.294565_g1806_i0.p1  ORF type:complete len:129 (+),score=16.47 NODE_2196_length_969_cov_83.294565_g1806_i0:263-649(+)
MGFHAQRRWFLRPQVNKPPKCNLFILTHVWPFFLLGIYGSKTFLCRSFVATRPSEGCEEATYGFEFRAGDVLRLSLDHSQRLFITRGMDSAVCCGLPKVPLWPACVLLYVGDSVELLEPMRPTLASDF